MDMFIRFVIYLKLVHRLKCYFIKVYDEVINEMWFVAYNLKTSTLKFKLQII